MMSIAMSYRKLITSIALIIFMINLESSDDSKYNDGFLRIQTQLNLTDEQTDQFKPIFLDYLKKRMDTMNKHGINRESRSNAQNIDIRQLRKFKKDMDKINKAVIDDLEEFIQTKSAWVTQVTLYGYLKTRMGTRYVLHFENDEFMKSVNLAKWNIYAVALQDMTFFAFSYLKSNFNYEDINKANEIFLKILDDETTNKMPLEIIENAKNEYNQRLQKINWDSYYNDLPFNSSALSLYKWSPISEELKKLDRKIVLNSMILKWDVVKKEFRERIKF